MKETLDERYTENMENIYKIIIKFVLQTLVTGYEMASAENKDGLTSQSIEVNVPNEQS